MTIGDRIRDRRKELNLSVDEVAEKLGKNRATVYRYESDEIENLPITVLEPLAKVLQTTPGHLMGWEDDNQIKKQPNNTLPSLTPKDEREIARDLEAMLNSFDNESGMAAYNDPEDEEDRELLKASLLTSMKLAKQLAKKKFTPKKYRK